MEPCLILSDLERQLGIITVNRGLWGLLLGLAAATGGAMWAVRRLFGTGDSGDMAVASGVPPVDIPRREGLDPLLLEILACPEDKHPVIYQKEGSAERLTCTSCGKRYPVRDGIPVMLIDEAQAGPVPDEAAIAAAKSLAPEGKPAAVGAA